MEAMHHYIMKQVEDERGYEHLLSVAYQKIMPEASVETWLQRMVVETKIKSDGKASAMFVVPDEKQPKITLHATHDYKSAVTGPTDANLYGGAQGSGCRVDFGKLVVSIVREEGASPPTVSVSASAIGSHGITASEPLINRTHNHVAYQFSADGCVIRVQVDQ